MRVASPILEIIQHRRVARSALLGLDALETQDQSTSHHEQLKTPALGLTWANQLSARIVLKMESDRAGQHPSDYLGGNIWKDKKKRRFIGVVFAPWTPPTSQLVEYEIASQGPVSVPERVEKAPDEMQDHDMLDPSLWFDGAAEDEEFP